MRAFLFACLCRQLPSLTRGQKGGPEVPERGLSQRALRCRNALEHLGGGEGGAEGGELIPPPPLILSLREPTRKLQDLG
jgi:hypothetical protein